MVAPMVGLSDLPFRLLCRRHNAHLAYTQMLFSDQLVSDEIYRQESLQTCTEDRPLVVQLCGNDAETLLRAARYCEPICDAVDLNLGCPQQRALDGHYGAYLLDKKDWETVFRIVRTLRTHLTVPIFCKIRLLPTLEMTSEFCRKLEQAGCSLIAIHGRQRGSPTARRNGPADLEAIRVLKSALSIPVITNGNVRSFMDVNANLAKTGADGIMSAEAVLADPMLFAGGAENREAKFKLAMEYLDLCKQWKVPMTCIKQHISYMLGRHGRGGMVSYQYFGSYNRHIDLKKDLDAADNISEVEVVLKRSLGLPNCKQGKTYPPTV